MANDYGFGPWRPRHYVGTPGSRPGGDALLPGWWAVAGDLARDGEVLLKGPFPSEPECAQWCDQRNAMAESLARPGGFCT